MTMPIAVLMGLYLRRIRPGKVLETSLLGFVLVVAAIFGGQWVSQTPSWAAVFTLTAPTLAILIILYGFAASALPVWLLLAPRDYLSTFVKLGTISLLALGIVALRPSLHMPPLTRFAYWVSAQECTIRIDKAREELGYAPVEAEELLRDAEGETAEELLGGALRLARSELRRRRVRRVLLQFSSSYPWQAIFGQVYRALLC